MHGNRGFSLIELMITVAVVALLATVAYPSYQSAIVKSRRAAAQAALSEIAQRQQQFLLDNRAYAASTGELNVTVPADVSRFYTVTINAPAGTPPTFIATATPTAAGGQLSDGAMTIDSAGTKSPAAKW